jgi:hypothetical protein
MLRRTVERELSDSGYIDAWEAARCWLVLTTRGKRWSWGGAREEEAYTRPLFTST